MTEGLGKDYEILHMDKKPYPCCRTTHHAIDAALALREQVAAEEIEEIRVETYGVGVLQCGSRQYPGNPGQAKFSISYTAAAALVKGRVTQEEFTEEVLADPHGPESCIPDPGGRSGGIYETLSRTVGKPHDHYAKRRDDNTETGGRHVGQRKKSAV